MEALKQKYEQNRAEVLKNLDVSKDLLELMTRHSLIDIADCVKYQGIHDVKKRNGSLMKTMVERRTEKAYPLFIQSLRQAGQDSVANLLTDIGEETRILTHLQSELEHEIGAITDYIHHEEKRTGMAPSGGKKGDPTPGPHPPLPVPTSDREVWVGVQSTLKRAKAQFERCRAVIDKLHQDCEDLAHANGDMVTQIRNCYSRVRRMLKPGQPSSQADAVPKNTQAMFHSLVEDVEKLMSRKSQAQQEENEGRTTAMRMLRHLRDWIQERSSILDTLHATSSPSSPRVNRLPLMTSRRGTGASHGGSHLHLHHNQSLPRHSSPRLNTPPPPRSQDTTNEGVISPVTFIGEAGGSGQGQAMEVAQHLRHVEPHAISTVLEGLHLLEQQVRRYVHMEILLTDKFRMEMRYRHLRKKSHGYTPRGLEEARKALEKLESGSNVHRNHTVGPGGDDGFYLTKLRASLDSMHEEYDACAAYMERIAISLVKIPNVDSFLAHTEDSHQHKKNKKHDKDRKNRQAAHSSTANDKSTSVFGFFSRGKKADASTSSSICSPFLSKPSGRESKLSNLPALATPTPNHTGVGDESLLSQLKLLVANYEMVKLKLNRLEDRYRREYDTKRRTFDATLRDREEEVASLQIRLKEVEAEKEKYRSLYEKMKITFAKKR